MSIYVAGSLAFDRIMSFNGAFADHILADKLHILNVSFLIDGLVEKRGGCAGNIAYTLALMGEKPLILATAGKNFSEYGTFLESKGISLEGVRVMKDEFTARWGSRASTRSRIPTLPPTGASYPPATSTT